ncbi:MAG TPA: polysaccharide biosynthesis C-terminal domain-containing protein, partial [Candidatus Binatia bacterium]|nr:polysaccharide biosynthesis C-terminal domain-containing protein [Candidatus Binatia bacterium]
NWILLPLFGYWIAAVTTLISYGFLCVTQALASRRYIRWPFPWQTALRSLSAGGLMGLVIFGFVNEVTLPPLWIVGLATPLGVLIYGCCILFSGEISPQERHSMELQRRRWLAHIWARS